MTADKTAYPQLSFTQTRFDDESLLGRTRRIVWSNTIPLQLDILKSTGRYDAFKLQYKKCYDDKPDHWPVPNHLFWDSDVAKWIEGACYFLHDNKDQKVEDAIHELVEMIRSAQQPDGYLNIHFTVVAPSKKYTNLRDLHELYNAGHLIEAALAHEHLYKNGRLLDPILKYVQLMCDTFGSRDGQIHGYPGHPEIELALLRLYSYTQDPHHLELGKYFIEERGQPQGCEGRHFYDVEAEKRGERPYERPSYYPQPRSYWYQQAHVPIVEQREIVGHSVRAMYLLTAVADMMAMAKPASISAGSDSTVDYTEALSALWENMVSKKMSVTGGIGAMKQWEGFGVNDFLPQSTDEGGCYNETCASIGILFLAERLLNLKLDRKYADVMEVALYNTVLTGMGRCGKKFTYVNQLGSSDQDLSKREDWFTCACCPPNVSRLMGSLGGYVWSPIVEKTRDRTQVSVNVHLFTSATLTVPTEYGEVEIVQESKYPWEENLNFKTTFPKDVDVILRIRIPSWAEGWSISPAVASHHRDGYLELSTSYLRQCKTDGFCLTIPLKVRTIAQGRSNPGVFALARGPIVYCIEDVDNPWVVDHFKSVCLSTDYIRITEEMRKDMPMDESYIALKVSGHVSLSEIKPGLLPGSDQTTYRPLDSIESSPSELCFVPYYLRANRGGKGQMRVSLQKLL